MVTTFSRRHFLGAALYGAVGGTLGACGGSNGGAGLDPSAPFEPVSDARVELAIGNIDQMAADLMQRTGVPGLAVAVVRGKPDGSQGFSTVYAKGFGVRTLGQPDKVDADSVFYLASMSKPIGATVVAQQIGAGKVSWDTPVQQHLPWFSLVDAVQSTQVTIGDMYAHRSGLPHEAGDPLEMVGYGRRYILEHLRELPVAPLRSRYAYSNFGMTAGAEAVVAAAGIEWADLSEQVLYQPLGMSRTSSRFADFAVRSNCCAGHVRTQGKWQLGQVRQPDAQSPAGGVTSSANDMARWLAFMLAQGKVGSKQVVDAKALSSTLNPQMLTAAATPDMAASYYGYGFVIGQSGGQLMYAHSGAFTTGASTTFRVVPATGMGIVVLTNGMPQGIPEALSAQFFDLLQFGQIQQDWLKIYAAPYVYLGFPAGSLAGLKAPDSPVPSQALATYVGSYQNAYYGTLQVALEDGALVVRVGSNAASMPLRHWTGEQFASAPPGDLFGIVGSVLFSPNTIWLEIYSGEDWGSFSRI